LNYSWPTELISTSELLRSYLHFYKRRKKFSNLNVGVCNLPKLYERFYRKLDEDQNNT